MPILYITALLKLRTFDDCPPKSQPMRAGRTPALRLAKGDGARLRPLGAYAAQGRTEVHRLVVVAALARDLLRSPLRFRAGSGVQASGSNGGAGTPSRRP